MIDWDGWRATYDTRTFQQHQAFNADVLTQHPVQRQWDGGLCRRFLMERRPATVVELGGWDGSLAQAMLQDLPPFIERWTNYDITPGVPQACNDTRYERVVLEDWPWNAQVQADVLVASHVLEHMRGHEVRLLLDAWDVRGVYVDCPIDPNGRDWKGYEGSHILELGSNDLLHLFELAGYQTSFCTMGVVAFLDR